MPPITPITKSELANILGILPQDLRQRESRWLDLMQEGVLVTLTVRRWRAQAKLDLADLGLTAQAGDLVDDLLKLGSKQLLPSPLLRQLTATESAGRKTLARFGIPTHWGAFVPATAFQAWRAADQEHMTRYFDLRDRIVADYETIVADLMADYQHAARLAFDRADRLAGVLPVSRSEFVQEFTQRVQALIPSPSAIYASFAWEHSFSYIPLPAMLADQQALDAALVDRLTTDARWREVAIADAADRAHRQELAAMHEAVLAEARTRKQELIDGFLSDLAVQLRSTVYNACTDVLAAMQRNDGKLHPRSVVQLRNLMEQVARLDFFGDADVGPMMEQVRQAFDTAAEHRNHDQIWEVLSDVATVTRQSLLALGQDPRPVRAAPVDPGLAPAVQLQRARRRLQLDMPPTDEPNPQALVLDLSSLYRAPRQIQLEPVSG